MAGSSGADAVERPLGVSLGALPPSPPPQDASHAALASSAHPLVLLIAMVSIDLLHDVGHAGRGAG